MISYTPKSTLPTVLISVPSHPPLPLHSLFSRPCECGTLSLYLDFLVIYMHLLLLEALAWSYFCMSRQHCIPPFLQMPTKFNVVSSHAIPTHLCAPNFALTGSRYDHFTGTYFIGIACQSLLILAFLFIATPSLLSFLGSWTCTFGILIEVA